MTAAVVAALLAAAVLAAPQRTVRARLPERPVVTARHPEWLRRSLFAGLAGTAAAMLIGGPAGAAAGVGVAAAVAVVLRRLSGTVQTDDPLAVAAGLDLLSACLLAGLPLSTAAGAVAGSLAGAPAMQTGLRQAGDLVALGGDAGAVWDSLAQAKGLEQLARLARRSADSGTSLAAGAAELAAAIRERAGDRALVATERAGVAVSGPLGLCFLPAFLCLGIAPVVLGLAGRVLDGGVL